MNILIKNLVVSIFLVLTLIGCANNPVTVLPSLEVERGSGCCSYHGGVCGCSGGRAVCCDGQLSPSCGCFTENNCG